MARSRSKSATSCRCSAAATSISALCSAWRSKRKLDELSTVIIGKKRCMMFRRYGHVVSTWGQFVIGLFGYALAVRLMIASGLGLGPWDSFHVGLNYLTGMSV